jgi:hypothetical protein
VTVGQEQLHVTIEKYLKQGEEYRLFSYPYRHEDKEYRNVYFYDRKKGAQKVTGFLVIETEGNEAECQLDTQINEAFNQYNLLFRRFQSDWGDVVQQDMRKFVAVKRHFNNLIEYYEGEASANNIISQGYNIVKDVLAYQDNFLALDLEAIELGQIKREQHFIDEQIDQKVRRITEEFEQTIFDQYYVQYRAKELRDRLTRFFEEQTIPKELKRSVKKVLRIFKKMDKNVLKNEDRLEKRIEDPKNEKHYTELHKEWKTMLRNRLK